MRKHGKLKLILTILIILLILIFIIFEKNIKPIVMEMASSKVRSIAIKAFNDAVKQVFSEGKDYSDLISVVLDHDGKVTMIQADTVKMNMLATETAMLTQNNIEKIEEQGIKIPAGSLLNSQILAGRGPKITIKIIPIGSVGTQFVTEFEEAGINQTRHKIYLQANMKVNIVVPTGNNLVEVATYVTISETIIIGDVPSSYIEVQDGNMLNLIPSE